MRQWLCKLLCAQGTEGELHDRMESIQREQRLLDIRRRIEEQRAAIERNQTRSDTTRNDEQIPPKTPSVDQARKAKNAELEDLKAKLTRKSN